MENNWFKDLFIDEAKQALVAKDGPTPDLSETDPTKPGYVEGRTHYECDYSFDASLDIPVGEKKSLAIDGLDITHEGAYWVVSINGDTTSRTAVYSGTVCTKIAGIEFGVTFRKDRKTGMYAMSVALSDVAPKDLHIEASYRYPGNVVTLDEKYIPDTIQRVGGDVIVNSSTE